MSLLLALLLAAPPARAGDTQEVLNVLHHFLTTGDTLRQENGRAELVVGAVPNGSNAIYDPHKEEVILSAESLASAEKELLACGELDPKSVDWAVAVHLLPTVAHELRHAYLHWRLGFLPSHIEDEVAGFANTMRLYHETRKNHPSAFKCSTTMSTKNYRMFQQYWLQSGDGVDGLTKFLGESSYYKQMCSLRVPSDVKACRRAAKAYLKEAEASGDPAKLKDAKARLAFWDDDDRLEEVLKYFQTVEFVGIRKLHGAHQRELAAQ